ARTTWLVVRAIGRGRSWALTGTPVENCPEDLVGVFEFVSPGFLSPDMKPSRMGRTVRDYLLRRTKEQVLADLPPKLFRDAEIELTPEQRETYDLARDEGVLRLTRMGESATIQHVFELVLRLKQICNFDPATGASAKLERLEADLEEVATSGRKALVFSQWVQTLRQLAGPLARFGPVEYHGEVPASRRDEVLRRFRDDPDCHVMLLSYGAGGVGLNLQFAHYVFLFDRWWNPAVEDQAINRAHRIGVSGPITVTRFLALDTIEERIDSVLREKRELFDLILSGAEGHRRLGLTQEEIFGLFDLRSPAGTDLAQARSRAV
ncbi:MAG: DEAD/DEAH box helicase, partial [Thermoguttaceae bacterium]|nr:DEAD/DEAH box helicase [Thermoguttaceae bacterium]